MWLLFPRRCIWLFQTTFCTCWVSQKPTQDFVRCVRFVHGEMSPAQRHRIILVWSWTHPLFFRLLSRKPGYSPRLKLFSKSPTHWYAVSIDFLSKYLVSSVSFVALLFVINCLKMPFGVKPSLIIGTNWAFGLSGPSLYMTWFNLDGHGDWIINRQSPLLHVTS